MSGKTAFRDQGGAASSDPSWLRRQLTSLMMRRLADPGRRDRARQSAERQRIRRGEAHRIDFFHDVADPYSHLAAQLLAPLCACHGIVLQPRLVADAAGPDTPEPALLAAWSRRDAAAIAPHYGLEFPVAARAPDPALLSTARGILAAQPPAAFPRVAPRVGQALWSGEEAALAALSREHGRLDEARVAERLGEDGALRSRLGHYAGAMFHYAGEWYWGVDRLYHLEERLHALGASHGPDAPLIAPRPEMALPGDLGAAGVTLEFFASLRSPYTSIVYERTLAFARASGVRLLLRPVLPMVMRGVPVTLRKGRYIFSDTAREAEAAGLRWGHACDPIGEPVRRLYSLLPWARSRGREVELFGEALKGAFFEAMDLGRERGLARVVERAGLPWSEARFVLGAREWEDEVERNRLALYAAGLWGVPAFRLLDAEGNPLLETWGQDRLWLVSRVAFEHRVSRERNGGRSPAGV